jgi:Ca2+/H+ antiporter
MLSRETVVQAGVGIVAIAAFLFVPNLLDVPFDSLGGVLAVILFDATIIGGGHLYLALRGEDAGFPVRSRWRTVALVTTLAGIAFTAQVLYRMTGLADQSITYVAVGIAVVSVVAYWYLEARDGYRDSKADQGTI